MRGRVRVRRVGRGQCAAILPGSPCDSQEAAVHAQLHRTHCLPGSGGRHQLHHQQTTLHVPSSKLVQVTTYIMYVWLWPIVLLMAGITWGAKSTLHQRWLFFRGRPSGREYIYGR